MNHQRVLTEGMDYTIRVIPFPNCAVDGITMSHPDIDCIYINSRVCLKRQQIALQHELEHLANDDLYNDELTTEEIEDRMSI